MAGRKPGTPKTGGRSKGTTNKLSGDVKAMILAALDKKGGAQYLVEVAGSNPAAFLALVGKVLPLTLASDPDDPLLAGLTVTFVQPAD